MVQQLLKICVQSAPDVIHQWDRNTRLTSGVQHLVINPLDAHGQNFLGNICVCVFSNHLVETMSARTQKQRRQQRKQEGGAKTRKLSPWNKFVQKVYRDMKRKNNGAKFGDALKEASRRKSEM